MGQNFIRTQLATMQGAAVPLPYGGKFRSVMVDLDPEQLFAKGLSPADVSDGARQPEPDSAGRHRQDRRQGLPGQAEQQPAHAGRDERPAGEGGERRDRLPAGRGAGARRLQRADQHRAHERQPRRAAHGAAERQGFHAGGRERRQGGAAEDPGRAAAGAARPAAVRSVAVRARGDQRRGARGGHRGVPHRPDDPAVPGKLAQHDHRLHLDSALDSGVADRHEPARARPST